VVTPQVPRTMAPLLGRESELATLTALLADARAGEGRLAIIEGGAGIGKTRLIAEARTSAAAHGFEVLTARAGELERDFAFGVVRQLFEPVLARGSVEQRAELLSGAAGLAAPLFDRDVLGRQGGERADVAFHTLHGLYWLTANIAQRAPAVLAVDDLHWSDDPSLRWLNYLARRLEGLPVLVLFASRALPSEPGSEALIEPLATLADTVLRPVPLRGPAVAALVVQILSTAPDEAFVAALEEASGGNPLFLRTMLDEASRARLTPTATNAAGLAELGSDALARSINVRLARLSEAARRLAEAASILGDGTEFRIAAVLADLDTATALTASTDLVRADLLRQVNPVEFTHPIVRSAVYGSIAAGERMRGQRRAAELLVDAGAVAERAATYLMLNPPDEDAFVVDVLRQAAQRSIVQGAPEAAVDYLQRALREPPPVSDRSEALRELGVAETRIFKAESAVDHLRQALTASGDVAKSPELVLEYTHALTLLALEATETVALLETLSDRVRDNPGLHERVTARLMIAGHYEPDLYPLVRKQWDSLRDEQKHRLSAAPLLAVGAVEEARRGIDRDRAVELAERALRAHVTNSADALYGLNALYTLTLAGRRDLAMPAFAEAIERSRCSGDRFATAFVHLFRGRLHAECGDLFAAEDDLAAPEVLAMPEVPALLTLRASVLTAALRERGRLDEARRLLSDLPRPTVHLGHRIYLLSAQGRLELDAGDAEAALASFTEAGDMAHGLGVENPAVEPWRSGAAIALHRLDRQAEARAQAAAELELSLRWGAPRPIGISLRALGLIEGGARGEQLLREAVGVLSASPARLELARTLVDLGAALRRGNSRREARERLRTGIDLAHQCGASALVDRANDELAATGAQRRTVHYPGVANLTASERRVARRAVDGASNRDIAQELFITVKTVEMHLGRVYRKLDITSRAQLAGALARSEAGHPAYSGD
jgi:DNA-binding CsgD family transcriptional regulator